MAKCNRHLAARRQRKQDLLPEIARLALEGQTSREIGEKLGIARSTVGRWRNAVRQEHVSKAVVDTAQLIADVTESYWSIFDEALEAWCDSRKHRQAECGEETNDEGRSGKEPSARAGNSAFLGKAMEALKAIRDIYGIDAPRRTEIAGPAGGPIALTAAADDDFRNMSDEQLLRIINETEGRGPGALEAPPGPPQLAGLCDVHQAGLPAEPAPRDPGREAGSGCPGPLHAADGLHAAPAWQERAGEPPLPGLHPGRES
jgi:transcriptional regulator with XRE-family HTH domain